MSNLYCAKKMLYIGYQNIIILNQVLFLEIFERREKLIKNL